MNTENLVITVYANDRPGIMQKLSDTVLAHGGNWLESSLTRLAGQFAGIVNIAVSGEQRTALQTALNKLADIGIHVTVLADAVDLSGSEHAERVELVVEANDRPGIVEEIASALAAKNLNIEHMDTECVSASMAGYQMFIARLWLALPDKFTVEQLELVLENVSDDLIVTIIDAD